MSRRNTVSGAQGCITRGLVVSPREDLLSRRSCWHVVVAVDFPCSQRLKRLILSTAQPPTLREHFYPLPGHLLTLPKVISRCARAGGRAFGRNATGKFSPLVVLFGRYLLSSSATPGNQRADRIANLPRLLPHRIRGARLANARSLIISTYAITCVSTRANRLEKRETLRMPFTLRFNGISRSFSTTRIAREGRPVIRSSVCGKRTEIEGRRRKMHRTMHAKSAGTFVSTLEVRRRYIVTDSRRIQA